MTFMGVEEPELFRENLKTYRELLFRRGEIEALLDPIRKEFELESSRVFSPPLRNFLRERSRRKDGQYENSVSAQQSSAKQSSQTAQTASPQLGAYLKFR